MKFPYVHKPPPLTKQGDKNVYNVEGFMIIINTYSIIQQKGTKNCS